jgi:hypothetical protein
MPCSADGSVSSKTESRRSAMERVLFWNCARGAVPKIDFINQYVADFKPVIFFISEAEIKKDKDYSCLVIDNYEIEYSKTVSFGMARTMAYLRKGSGFRRVGDLEGEDNELIIITNGRQTYCGVYRPFKNINNKTSAELFEGLLSKLDRVIQTYPDVTVGGDWNINWHSNSSLRRKLANWSETHGLVQSINETTRHQCISTTDGEKLRQSCIDLIFQSSPKKVDIMNAEASDHCLLVLNLGTPAPKIATKKIVTFDWRNYTKQKAAHEMSKAMSSPFNPKNDLFDELTSKIVGVCNILIPKRTIRLRGPHEFENSRIEAMKKRRDRAWKSFKKTGDEYYYEKSKSLSKKLKQIIKRERQRVFRAKLNSQGETSFWRTVSNVFNSKAIKDDLTLKNDEGGRITDKAKIADKFADFFEGKIKILSSKTSPRTVGEAQMKEDSVMTVLTDDEVRRAFRDCRSKKSSGHDEVPMVVLKDGSEALIPMVKILFNNIIRRGRLPEDWKIAKVVPIHKKGAKDDVSNYRPVSNLCSLSKVFERCVLQRIKGINELENAQHGFKRGHSTVTAALELQHHIASALDRKRKVAVYSLDLSAAFDLLRPDLLVSQLKETNVEPPMTRIVMDFLQDRRAFVCIDDQFSKVFNIPVGVPQGSVLGPILFSYYTSGLSDVINSSDTQIVIYADDSYVVCQADSLQLLESVVVKTFKKHVKWLRDLGMLVNEAKTELMFFGEETLTVQVDEQTTLKSEATMSVLGIVFDRKLSWESHLSRAVNGCQRMKPALRVLKKKLSRKELLKVITTHYYSRLYYGSEVWFQPLKKVLKDSISPVHYFPLRLALNDFNRLTSRKSINLKVNRAPPNELNEYKLARILISISNNQDPFVLFYELLSHSVVETRKPHNPKFLDMSRTRLGRQSLANRVNVVAMKLKFEWLHVESSKELLRKNLKKSFFSYFS